MKKRLIYLLLLITTITSCDFLDKEPIGMVIPETVSDFRGLLTSSYDKFPRHKQLLTVRADELSIDPFGFTFNSHRDIAIWNDHSADSRTYTYQWGGFYNVIFYANHVIKEGYTAFEDDSESREQIIAEAYLIRAYAHFELINMYGRAYDAQTAATDKGVPISTYIDIEQEYFRNTVQEVYDQIWKDINDGERLMQVTSQPSGLNYRFSKVALEALKARVSLYQKNWEDAHKAASKVIDIKPELEDLNTSSISPVNFKSKESILALERVSNFDHGDDFSIAPALSSLYDMANDKRVGFYFKKLSSGTLVANKCHKQEEQVTFRTAEAYLIAAEASAQLGHSAEAIGYLTTLINHRLTPEAAAAKSATYAGMSKEQLISEILNERTRELAFEGHRWFDLRRTNQPEIVKAYLDPLTFEFVSFTLKQGDARYTIRIPKEAIANNPNLND